MNGLDVAVQPWNESFGYDSIETQTIPFSCGHGEDGACSGQWVSGLGQGGCAGRAGSLQHMKEGTSIQLVSSAHSPSPASSVALQYSLWSGCLHGSQHTICPKKYSFSQDTHRMMTVSRVLFATLPWEETVQDAQLLYRRMRLCKRLFFTI